MTVDRNLHVCVQFANATTETNPTHPHTSRVFLLFSEKYKSSFVPKMLLEKMPSVRFFHYNQINMYIQWGLCLDLME